MYREQWLFYDVFGLDGLGDLSFFFESALPLIFLPAHECHDHIHDDIILSNDLHVDFYSGLSGTFNNVKDHEKKCNQVAFPPPISPWYCLDLDLQWNLSIPDTIGTA